MPDDTRDMGLSMPVGPKQNHLLAALDHPDYDRLRRI